MFQWGCKWGFEGSIKGISRMFQGSFKGVSRMFHGSFNDVLRKFQGCLKIVSSVLLHGSHRSYPSRRRACFLLSDKLMEVFAWMEFDLIGCSLHRDARALPHCKIALFHCIGYTQNTLSYIKYLQI